MMYFLSVIPSQYANLQLKWLCFCRSASANDRTEGSGDGWKCCYWVKHVIVMARIYLTNAGNIVIFINCIHMQSGMLVVVIQLLIASLWASRYLDWIWQKILTATVNEGPIFVICWDFQQTFRTYMMVPKFVSCCVNPPSHCHCHCLTLN